MAAAQRATGRLRPGRPLPAGEARVLAAIAEALARHDPPPTKRELARRLGVSTFAVAAWLLRPERRGLVRRRRGRARGLVVLARPPRPSGPATWTRAQLQRPAAGVVVDALCRSADTVVLAPSGPWQARRRRWLTVLTDDVELVEAGLARFLALRYKERAARLASLAVEPTEHGRRRWDHAKAFAGKVVVFVRR